MWITATNEAVFRVLCHRFKQIPGCRADFNLTGLYVNINLSLFTHPHVDPNPYDFLLWNTEAELLSNFGAKEKLPSEWACRVKSRSPWPWDGTFQELLTSNVSVRPRGTRCVTGVTTGQEGAQDSHLKWSTSR